MQYNKIKYLINYFQIKKFTYFIDYNIIIFLVWIQKEEKKVILLKFFFSI